MSCLRQSSRWSSFNISIGVCRCGRALKYAYTSSCTSLCFPLMYSDNATVFTTISAAFFPFPPPAHLSNATSTADSSPAVGTGGVRCNANRWIRRVTVANSEDSSSAV
uniref:Uncharacterized protein n=1 Tax=Opuntia streptacantha TaxID=393608 RepID=A0A7C9AY01_OPUST